MEGPLNVRLTTPLVSWGRAIMPSINVTELLSSKGHDVILMVTRALQPEAPILAIPAVLP